MNRSPILRALGLLLVLGLAGGLCFAFGVGEAVAQKDGQKRRKGQPRVITLEAEVIEGTVQKPEAFYILQRSELNFKGLEPKKSFIPLILKSVEKEPF